MSNYYISKCCKVPADIFVGAFSKPSCPKCGKKCEVTAMLDTPGGVPKELKYCDKCIQMTNHSNEGCLKCMPKEEFVTDPLKLIKFHPQYKDLAKEADERIQIQIDAYNDAKEEFVKMIESKKDGKKCPEGWGCDECGGCVDLHDEALDDLLADIKSKLNI